MSPQLHLVIFYLQNEHFTLNSNLVSFPKSNSAIPTKNDMLIDYIGRFIALSKVLYYLRIVKKKFYSKSVGLILWRIVAPMTAVCN